MNKNELYRLIQETDQKNQRNKAKRCIKTILSLSLALFLIFFFRNCHTISAFLEGILVSIVITFIWFFVSTIIFSQLFSVSQREDNYLESLKKRLYDMENPQQPPVPQPMKKDTTVYAITRPKEGGFYIYAATADKQLADKIYQRLLKYHKNVLIVEFSEEDTKELLEMEESEFALREDVLFCQ